jgi:hypothetical protein
MYLVGFGPISTLIMQVSTRLTAVNHTSLSGFGATDWTPKTERLLRAEFFPHNSNSVAQI